MSKAKNIDLIDLISVAVRFSWLAATVLLVCLFYSFGEALAPTAQVKLFVLTFFSGAACAVLIGAGPERMKRLERCLREITRSLSND